MEGGRGFYNPLITRWCVGGEGEGGIGFYNPLITRWCEGGKGRGNE